MRSARRRLLVTQHGTNQRRTHQLKRREDDLPGVTMKEPRQAAPSILAAAVLLIGLLATLPAARAQTPETLTGPGTFERSTATLTVTILLAGEQDRSQVTVNAATGVITVEVLQGTATVTSGGITIEMPTTAVVDLAQDPDTGVMTVTVVSGPAVTVTVGGVTTVVAAGTSISLLPDGTLAPPALAVEPLPPPLFPTPAVPSPVIGREVPLSPAQ
jgi:hypothetical protein